MYPQLSFKPNRLSFLELNYNLFVTLLNVSGEQRSSRPRADLTGEGLRNSSRILDTWNSIKGIVIL